METVTKKIDKIKRNGLVLVGFLEGDYRETIGLVAEVHETLDADTEKDITQEVWERAQQDHSDNLLKLKQLLEEL